MWLATDERDGAEVAVKFVRDALSRDDAALLAREASMLGRARHPHVVELREVIEDDGHVGLVMELCQGSLEGLVSNRGRLPPWTVADIGLQLLAGLGHAHERGVLHLDIKPANLLVSKGGKVKLTDFGIATVYRRLDSTTHTSALWGTLPFLAPERRFGWVPSAATDIYAVGMTLAWLAVGSTIGELHVPATEDKLRGLVPPDLANVLVRAAQYSHEDRYASAEAMRAALATAREQLDRVEVDLTSFAQETPFDTLGPPQRRRIHHPPTSRFLSGVLGLSAIVAGLGAGTAGWALLRTSAPDGVLGTANAGRPDEPEAGSEPPSGLTLPMCAQEATDFRPLTKLGPRETSGALAADADGDGYIDLLFTNQLSGSLSIYWGGVEPLMSEFSVLTIDRSNAAALVGDIDEDGIPDLLTTHQDEASFAIHRGLGDRHFGPQEKAFQAPAVGRASLVDWNADGHLDLLMSIEEGGHCTAWRRGHGNGEFDPHQCIGPIASGSVHPFGRDPAAVYRVDDRGRLVQHVPSTSFLMSPAEVLLTPEQFGGELSHFQFPVNSDDTASPLLMTFARTASEDLLIAVHPGSPSLRACIYSRAPSSSGALGDIADVNGDGLPDIVEYHTCSGCESNHTVRLAVP